MSRYFHLNEANLELILSRHKLARTLFHGKRGELRQRYREGQEDQLGALGLVVNMIVPWNTIYIDAVLTQLKSEGYPLQEADVAHLWFIFIENAKAARHGRLSADCPDGLYDDSADASTWMKKRFNLTGDGLLAWMSS